MTLLSTSHDTLLCALTAEEFDARSTALARLCQDITSEEQRHGDVKAQLKAALTKLQAERDSLALVVGRRAELRDVATRVMADFARGEALVIREDTGEVVRRRALTEFERQESLFRVSAEHDEVPPPARQDDAHAEFDARLDQDFPPDAEPASEAPARSKTKTRRR